MKRSIKCFRRAEVRRRAGMYRPQLEALEARLPPGDTVCGAFLASCWKEPSRRVLGADAPGSQNWLGEAIVVQSRHAQRKVTSKGPTEDQRAPPEPCIANEKVALFDLDDFPACDNGIWAAKRLVQSGAGMEVTHIRAATEAPIAFVAVELVQLPSATFAAVVNSQVGYSAADSASLQRGIWQSTPSDDPPRAESQGEVHALFHLNVKTEAPFPTNWFTVPDQSNLTGLRVNLPYPDCRVFVSDCEDLNVINQLDGFNLQPRLSIPFDGPIDVNSVTSQSVFLISLGDAVGRHESGQVVGINQVVWDPPSNTLHVESDELLDQHTRYALILTNGLRSAEGTPVEASQAFRNFRQDVRGEYKHELLDAIHAARRLGIRESDIVDASVFTTESATANLEKIRDQIHAATPEPADFLLGPNGTRTVFNLDDVKGIMFNEQTGDNPPRFTPIELDTGLLHIIPGAVGEIAFGKYVSPDYEIHPGEYIPQVGTNTGIPAVQGVNEIYFNLFLPSGPKPADGWPVAIFGQGNAGNKNLSLNVAATMATQGIATISINFVGQGFGPLGTLTVNQTVGGPVIFSAGGRGIDQDGDHIIGNNEGLGAAPPRQIIFFTDGLRQTVADLMQLVRVIQVGMDVHGDGVPDLDPSRVYYFGASFGGNTGTVLLSAEPDVGAGVLNVAGGPFLEARRLAPDARPTVGTMLASRAPSLLNAPGLTSIGGVPVAPPYFNENLPLRNQPSVINTVAGATAIQELFDNFNWVGQSGYSAAYAPHLRKAPLAGVPAKAVIFQFAKGDESAPNPTNSALLRAGDLADRATFYRNDLAYADDPAVPKNPHAFMISINVPALMAIAMGAQEQIATFFASDGKEIIHPEPAKYFEVPIQRPLPEDLNYIP